MRFRALALVLLATAACKTSTSDAPAAKQVDPTGHGVLLGIRPENWVCENVAPIAELGAVLGATPQPMETPMSSSPGLAKPCAYTIPGPPGPGADATATTLLVWTFDLDCRPGHQERAETELAQWTALGEERIAEYMKQVGPEGKAPTDDAGVAFAAPEGSRDVAVGRRALDVLGKGLIFIDDDAPCNVRVVGDDPDQRLAISQMIAKHLTEANAPMTPHQRPVVPRPSE